jgi:hypothetical protein
VRVTTTDYILLMICLMVAGRYAADFWRLRHPHPHTRYTTMDAAVDAMTLVADGLHQDIDGLRHEVRNAVGLPKDTQVPRLLLVLRRTQAIAWTSMALNIVGGLLLLWLVLGR